MAITLGVDVSTFQDPSGSGDRNLIDWAQVMPTPYDFALARMSIGRGTVDEDGRQNLRAMLGRIPVPGAYGVVGTSVPVEDGAKLLVDEITACGVDPRSILVMLDAENFGDGSHPSLRQINRYAIQLHTELGTWPAAYVPDWFLDQLAAAGDGDGTVRGLELANCRWVPSEYIAAPWTETRISSKRPANLRGFAGLAWHQFTSDGTVPGITGRVDLNAYYGTLDQLRARLLGQPQEDLNIVDDATKAYLDDLKGDILTRINQAVQRVGGRTNSVYNNNTPDYQGLVMAKDLEPIDADAVAALVAGQLEVTGISTDTAGVVTVTFGPKA